MKKKKLILKAAVAMLVFGSFGVVSNSAYAMEGNVGSVFASDKLKPEKVGSFEIMSKPSVDDVKSTDLNLEQQEKKNKIESKLDKFSESVDRLHKKMLPMKEIEKEFCWWPDTHLPEFDNGTELGKKMASKFENVLDSLYFLAGNKYKHYRYFDPERIGEEPLPGSTKEDLEETRSTIKKVYRDELIKNFDQVNDYLKKGYDFASSYQQRGLGGALEIFGKDLYWFMANLVNCLDKFENKDEFYDATKLNVAGKDRSIFWNFAFDKDILERVVAFAEICDKAFGGYCLFRTAFKHQPEEVLKAIESNM